MLKHFTLVLTTFVPLAYTWTKISGVWASNIPVINLLWSACPSQGVPVHSVTRTLPLCFTARLPPTERQRSGFQVASVHWGSTKTHSTSRPDLPLQKVLHISVRGTFVFSSAWLHRGLTPADAVSPLMSSTIIPIKHVYYPIWITSYNQLDREYHGQGAQCLKLPQVGCKRIKGPLGGHHCEACALLSRCRKCQCSAPVDSAKKGN